MKWKPLRSSLSFIRAVHIIHTIINIPFFVFSFSLTAQQNIFWIRCPYQLCVWCVLACFCAVECLIRAEVDLQIEVIILYHFKPKTLNCVCDPTFRYSSYVVLCVSTRHPVLISHGHTLYALTAKLFTHTICWLWCPSPGLTTIWV